MVGLRWRLVLVLLVVVVLVVVLLALVVAVLPLVALLPWSSVLCLAVVFPAVVLHGGQVGFASGDTALLYEEIRLLQPTFLNSVPRFFDRLYQLFQQELATQLDGQPTWVRVTCVAPHRRALARSVAASLG